MVNGRKNGWWLELSVDESYKAHGLLLGGGFYYLGSDSSGCRHGSGTIDGKVEHEGSIIPDEMIVWRDR